VISSLLVCVYINAKSVYMKMHVGYARQYTDDEVMLFPISD